MSLSNEFFRLLSERHLKTRPVVNVSACIGCGGCKKACPAKAIDLFACMPLVELPPKTGEPRFRPETAYSMCTRCYRCQEFCPQNAIETHKPRLMGILRL